MPTPPRGSPPGERHPSPTTTAPAGAAGSGARSARGRASYRTEPLDTRPQGAASVRPKQLPPGAHAIDVLSNYIKVTPMPQKPIFQYRIDFEPDIEVQSVRRRLLLRSVKDNYPEALFNYDGVYDARSGYELPNELIEFDATNPLDDAPTKVKIKRVGNINDHPLEMIRVYNINMKTILRRMGFFQVSKTGSFVHPEPAQRIERFPEIMIMRGYRTTAVAAEGNNILMNLESVHKLMQRKNVLQVMGDIRQQAIQRGLNLAEGLKAALVGKLVVTAYDKKVYRIEDINLNLKPSSTFPDRKSGRDVQYVEYYKTRHNCIINELNQPLIRVVPNERRRQEQEQSHDIYLVPELCNIAGLTEEQRNSGQLRNELIRATQVEPAQRVQKLNQFLAMIHTNEHVRKSLDLWNYDLAREAVKIKACLFATETICVGARQGGPGATKWEKIDSRTASFDSQVLRERLAKPPSISKMAIVIPSSEQNNSTRVLNSIRDGFDKIGLKPDSVKTFVFNEDSAHGYTQQLRQLPDGIDMTLVLMANQNKSKYDAVKKLCAVERGMITQVVTSKLMLDARKASGAAVKIGIQMAAKCGGEPWHIALPLKTVMIVGYDTYHDSADRNSSFGAFVASLNDTFGQWYSKADRHERMDDLTGHLTQNFEQVLEVYKKHNQTYPNRVFFYRDGVSDGQLEHVFKVELQSMLTVLKGKDIKLTYIIVNKRVGARFYLNMNNNFTNCMPGTVIDDVVTRQHRFDFYLISQSTRHGTVAPTYYNIIYDDTGMDPGKHQSMAFKLCLLYYNWTGSVRVPAPCQYAHKLAQLCGEHLHGTPSSIIEERLHFL